MKTSFIKPFAALFTFTIGIGVFVGYWNMRLENQVFLDVAEPSLKPIPIQTTFCEIVDGQKLNGKLVSFEITAYVVDETIILNPENCYFRGNNDPLFAKLALDSYTGKFGNLKKLLEGKDRETREDFKEVDIRVTGTAGIVTESDGYKIYSVVPVEIDIVSPFRKFAPKGGA